MKKISINSNFTIFEDIDDLPAKIQELVLSAKNIRKNAYSKYSNFSVGVSILLEDDTVVDGSNQENAAYPSGLCAERTAIFYANSNYPHLKIKCLVIVAGSNLKSNSTPIAPCGACRQVIAEYENKQNSEIELYFMGETGKIIHSKSIENLLPFKFDSSFL
jgi:cytidine deaminase